MQDAQGTVTEQRQLYGRIKTADPRRRLTLLLEGMNFGKTYTLPPDLRSLRPAPRSQYHLRATGEVVVDPDFLATWIVEAPAA